MSGLCKCAAAAGALLFCSFNMSNEAVGKDFDSAKFSELDATFYNKNDLKGDCSPCKNDFGNAESCNPECGADIFSASFSCEPDRRSISLILGSFDSKERLKVLEEVLKTNGVILLSGGKSDERSITEITFSVSDYNGTWILSLRGYDFQELLKAKLKDKQRSFTIKIGGLSYNFKLASNDFESAFQRLIAKCDGPQVATAPQNPAPDSPKPPTFLESSSLRRWAIETPMNCGVLAKSFSLRLDDGNVIWRDGIGNTDIESVVFSNETEFRTITVSSIHTTRRGERPGTAWNYSRIGADRIWVKPSGKRAFLLAQCPP